MQGIQYFWLIAVTLLLNGCASTMVAPSPIPAQTSITHQPMPSLSQPPTSVLPLPTGPIQKPLGLQRDCQRYQVQAHRLQQKLTKRPHSGLLMDDFDQIQAVVKPLCAAPGSGTPYPVAQQEIRRAMRDVEQLSRSASSSTP